MQWNKIGQYLRNPCKIVNFLGARGWLKCFPDKLYLQLKYYAFFGKKLNLKNPKTLNEKLQWLKLYDRNPKYTEMVDKYNVRRYIAATIGEDYLIPLLGVWDKVEDIDFSQLPSQFVLKCTHDSGGLVICKDKNKLDIEDARKRMKRCLRKNYYYHGREWPYKNVKPRIIAEKYMVDKPDSELKDYKIFNFSGKAKMIQVDYDRFSAHKRNLYTPEWQYIDVGMQYPTHPEIIINKPKTLDTMLELASKLSAGYAHVRTDFYSIKDKVFFGEMTFYPESGFGKFTPESFGVKMGDWLELPVHKTVISEGKR